MGSTSLAKHAFSLYFDSTLKQLLNPLVLALK